MHVFLWAPSIFASAEIVQASQQEVNERAAVDIAMNRFRTGCAAFEEDQWQRFTVGTAHNGAALDLESVKPCSRCSVTNVQQETGDTGPETLQTLMKFRTGRQLAADQLVYNDPEFENAAFFSWNLIPHGEGVVQVGDELQVTSVRST
jgi:uncharacterized protein